MDDSNALPYTCMTKQNENRVADIYNAVSVRSEADSNRCTRFCRPLPSHSAIRPVSSSRTPATLPQPFTLLPPVRTRSHASPTGPYPHAGTEKKSHPGLFGSANIRTFPINPKLKPYFPLFVRGFLLRDLVFAQNSLSLYDRNDILRP